MQTLVLDRITQSPGRHHLAVARLAPGGATVEHTHRDFCEYFLVTGGRGEHVLNGRSIELQRGCLAHVRMADRHYYRANRAEPLVFANLAVPLRWWHAFARAFYGPGPGAPEASPPASRQTILPEHECRRAEQNLLALLGKDSSGPGDVLAVVAQLERLLAPPPSQGRPEKAPEWLENLARDMKDPGLLAEPLAFWQKRSGRSAEHFARTCRRCYGYPPSELLNRSRIAFVTSRLGIGQDKIVMLALDAGYQNLGYFYRTFRRIVGCAPGAWLARIGADRAVPR